MPRGPYIPFAPLPGASRNKLHRAGAIAREWWEGEEAATPDELRALVLLIRFRKSFQAPLNKTVVGLRSMVCSEVPEFRRADGGIPVVQRLKRREQILNKLSRFPTSSLPNMGDIGGCRAILDSPEQVDGVVKRIRKNWHVLSRVRDTRDEPNASGYRAVHVIVVRDGRRIEIQLRDRREHEWAVAVERTGARLNIGLKEGEGPAELKEYFRLASLGMYRDSVGYPSDPEFAAEFSAARELARPHFRGLI